MGVNFNNIPRYIKREIDPPDKLITQGKKGAFPLRIQEWLHYHDHSTAIDADFGPATATQIKAFQKKRGIRSTGSVNKITWDALVAPMAKALAQPSIGERDTASRTVEKVAHQHLAQTPIEIGGANKGPWVRLYCGGEDGSQWAWCAGFVSLILQQSYFYRGARPPVEGSVSCDILKTQADQAGLFVGGNDAVSGMKPLPSRRRAAIFLRRKSDNDWDHTGFVVKSEKSSQDRVLHTIEGNTNNAGSREGIKAMRRTRTLFATKRNYDFIYLD